MSTFMSQIMGAEWEAAMDTVWTTRAVADHSTPVRVLQVVAWSKDGQLASRIAGAIVDEHNTRREMADVLAKLIDKQACQHDPLNPCWDNRPSDVPGKHWGVGDACPVCAARALLARIDGGQSTKRFRVCWSEAFVQAGVEEHGIDFFSAGNGYAQDEIEAIDALPVGSKWISPEWGEAHTVERIA